ncbi:helix-turn-helix domain-containing protein [Pseudovibrio sp. FO-BEG1]|uniref:helix-turn-helix domain-containing protein n=1 Tax=Pseudovibrio sp. (strain FO-BEG1) TaxID=911045 RepID=UPI00059FBA10|nr:helix-turn-helix transcriptional regulator [Pseudovibrio sp. FO-BEG1]
MKLGTRLKSSRKKAGFKSAESAIEALGVPTQTYQSYELSRRTPGLDRLKELARAFECDLLWLISGGNDIEESGINGTALKLAIRQAIQFRNEFSLAMEDDNAITEQVLANYFRIVEELTSSDTSKRHLEPLEQSN